MTFTECHIAYLTIPTLVKAMVKDAFDRELGVYGSICGHTQQPIDWKVKPSQVIFKINFASSLYLASFLQVCYVRIFCTGIDS